MEANFQRSLQLVLKHEGGFIDHPDDPGGATNKGVTIATMRRYISKSATVDDLKRITDAQVATIYRRHYWDKVKGDDLPSGVDYAVFDFAINSGPTRAAKYLQGVLGVAQDGVIGPVTLAAVRRNNPSHVIEALCADRLAFLKRLKHWPTFGRGWTRRVYDVREYSLALAAEKPASKPKPSPTVPLPSEPEPAPAGKGGLIGAILIAITTALYAFWQKVVDFVPFIGG